VTGENGRPWALSPRDKAWIFLLALAARLATTALTGFASLRFGDSVSYLKTAVAWLSTGRYPSDIDLYFFRAPGYPAFLIASTLGHPTAIVLDKLWSAILGSLTPLVLGAIALRLSGRRAVALAAGIAAAVHPGFIVLSAGIQSEPLFLFLLTASGFLLLVAVDRPSSGMALGAGGALAFASLTRPSALALVPLLAAPLLDRRLPLRVRRALAGSALFGFALLLAPWTARNALAYHALVPVNNATGYSFLQGNSALNVDYYSLQTPSQYARWLERIGFEIRSVWPSLPGARDPDPLVRSRALVEEGWRWIRAHPAEERWLLEQKTLDWLRPWASSLVWGRSIQAATGVEYGLLFLLAAAGLATAPRRGSALFAIAVLAISMAAHVALQVVWRYRMPYWDPILIVYGAKGAFRLAAARTAAP